MAAAFAIACASTAARAAALAYNHGFDFIASPPHRQTVTEEVRQWISDSPKNS
jgi:hypothetical protein